MATPLQFISLVGAGGTPVRLADAKGRPYPTTGEGSIVFSRNPTLINPTLIGWSIDGSFSVSSRLVSDASDTTIADTDVALFVNRTQATEFALPAPTLGRPLIFKDYAGNAATYNITLTGPIDSGVELAIQYNYGVIVLLGMGVKWGIIL